MSKISRFVGNLVAFASGALGTERTVFGDVTQSDTLAANVNADFIRGWEAGVDINGFPPKQYFNAIGYTSTQLAAYLHQMGIAEYDALQEYHIGSLCNVAGEIFSSKTNTNVGNTPVTLSETTYWVSYKLRATTTVNGLVELATSAETTTGTDTVRAVTPAGLLAVTAVNKSIGVGQTWQKLTATRAPATTYTNSTGRPIFVHCAMYSTVNSTVDGYINGVLMFKGSGDSDINSRRSIEFIVPPGDTYLITMGSGTPSIEIWSELR